MTTTQTPCRYCEPKGTVARKFVLCERHTTLFEKLDRAVFGHQLIRSLGTKHREQQPIILIMNRSLPQTKEGDVVGEVVFFERVEGKNFWRVRDLNENLWVAESSRKDLVKFTPEVLDSGGN